MNISVSADITTSLQKLLEVVPPEEKEELLLKPAND